jgi:hypothetical protein
MKPVLGIILAACCATPTGGDVAKHVGLFLQYARDGERAEAEAERSSMIKAFDASLEANSSDVSEFLNASCDALGKRDAEILDAGNANMNAARALLGALPNFRTEEEKVCPLAEKQRELEVGLLLTETAIVHKNCGSADFVEETKDTIADQVELQGLAEFYCKDGVLKVMQ